MLKSTKINYVLHRNCCIIICGKALSIYLNKKIVSINVYIYKGQNHKQNIRKDIKKTDISHLF